MERQNKPSLIERIDNSFYRGHERIVEKWQDVTGKSQRDLTSLTYFTSAAAFASGLMEAPFVSPFLAGGSTLMGIVVRNFPLPDPVYQEHPFGRGLRLAIYGASSINLLNAASEVIAHRLFGSEMDLGNMMKGLSFGMGQAGFGAATYFQISNPRPPKRKKERKPLKQKIKDLAERVLNPPPEPEPATVTAYRELERDF